MNGLLKGLRLFTEFLALRAKVLENNEAARPEFDAVEDQWLMELTATKTLEKAIESGELNEQSILLAFALRKDPFKGSRKLFQALKAKYA